MSQKILITGGSGLLGSYLIRWLRQKGNYSITATYQHSIETIPEDIRNGVEWKQLVLPDKIAALEIVEGQDQVIHAAGLVSYRKADKYRLLEINQTGTEHIVNACLAHSVSHLVYIGSIGSLGKETDYVILSESSPWLDNEFSTSYGLSKYLGEVEVWRGAGEGLNVSVLLPGVILGSGDWTRSSLQLLDRIVNKAPWYPAGQTAYVDVRDVVAFAGQLLENSNSGERWILNGKNMPYKEVYEKLALLLDLKKHYRLAPKWLAEFLLMASNTLRVGRLGTEMIQQAYGTFTYDASKSLTLNGFKYRQMETTLREVAEQYRKTGSGSVLPF